MNKEYDYSLLKGKMAEKGYTLTDLAETMGIARSALSRKINNRSNSGFTQREMVSIAKILDINLDNINRYFFYIHCTENRTKKAANKILQIVKTR